MVPVSMGIYPTFPAGSSDQDNNCITSEFIRNEKGIKMAEVMERLMGQQVSDAIDGEYYMEVEDPIFKYTRVKTTDLLQHILNNYSIPGKQVIKVNRLA